MNYQASTTEELIREIEYIQYIVERREQEENLLKMGIGGVNLTNKDGSITKVPLWQTVRRILIREEEQEEKGDKQNG